MKAYNYSRPLKDSELPKELLEFKERWLHKVEEINQQENIPWNQKIICKAFEYEKYCLITSLKKEGYDPEDARIHTVLTRVSHDLYLSLTNKFSKGQEKRQTTESNQNFGLYKVVLAVILTTFLFLVSNQFGVKLTGIEVVGILAIFVVAFGLIKEIKLPGWALRNKDETKRDVASVNEEKENP